MATSDTEGHDGRGTESRRRGRWSRRARASSPPTRAAARSRSASTRSAASRPRTAAARTARCCSPPPGAADYVSGVILFDETIRQNGVRRPPARRRSSRTQGIIPGIKVDKGAAPLAKSPERARHRRARRAARAAGRVPRARRAVREVARGDHDRRATSRRGYCLDVNAHALARYAALCQEEGIVPIVEPEVLMDGDHSLERCYQVTTDTLHTRVRRRSTTQRVELEGMLLKPNMVIPGKEHPSEPGVARRRSPTRRSRASARSCPPPCPASCSSRAARATRKRPRTSTRSTRKGPHPWQLSFSYGRALQAPALKAWKGDDANVGAGRGRVPAPGPHERPGAAAGTYTPRRREGRARSGTDTRVIRPRYHALRHGRHGARRPGSRTEPGPLGAESGPVRGRDAAGRAGPRGRRCGLGQDPGAHAPPRVPRRPSSACRRSRSSRSRSRTRPRARCASGSPSSSVRSGTACGCRRSTPRARASCAGRRRCSATGRASRSTTRPTPIRLTDWVRRDLNLDPKRFPARQLHAQISALKNELVLPRRVRGRWRSVRPSAASPRSTPSTSAGWPRRRPSTSTTCSCSPCACSASTPKRS